MTRAAWRTALITGASSGIGEALARRLAKDGVEMVLAARRVAKLEALAEEVRAAGAKAHVVELDVARTEHTVDAIRRADADLGGLDLVIANAGLGKPQNAHTLSWEKASETFATNFMGAMATLTAVLPRMVERGRGHLVGMSSVAVYSPTPGGSAYRATKSGMTAFLENLRAELGGTGVRVTAIHPGFVQTPMADNFKPPANGNGKTVKPAFVVSAPDAADLIVRKLRRAPARIDFPFPIVMMIKAIGSLPEFVRDPMVRRMKLGEGE